jgi:hypothetical protein
VRLKNVLIVHVLLQLVALPQLLHSGIALPLLSLSTRCPFSPFSPYSLCCLTFQLRYLGQQSFFRDPCLCFGLSPSLPEVDHFLFLCRRNTLYLHPPRFQTAQLFPLLSSPLQLRRSFPQITQFFLLPCQVASLVTLLSPLPIRQLILQPSTRHPQLPQFFSLGL